MTNKQFQVKKPKENFSKNVSCSLTVTTKQCTKERHESVKLFFYFFKAVIVFLRFLLPSSSWDPTFSNLPFSRKVVGKSARDNPERYCG